MALNPLADDAPTDGEDRELVAQVQAGSRDALERLVVRHQPWIYAPEVTYFDPVQDRRVDGLEAVTAMLAPITGKIRVDRYEHDCTEGPALRRGRRPDVQPSELPSRR